MPGGRQAERQFLHAKARARQRCKQPIAPQLSLAGGAAANQSPGACAEQCVQDEQQHAAACSFQFEAACRQGTKAKAGSSMHAVLLWRGCTWTAHGSPLETGGVCVHLPRPTRPSLRCLSLLLHAVMDAPFSRRAWQGRKAAWDFTAREVQSPDLLTKEPADQPLLSTFFLNRNRYYCYLQKKYVLEWFSIRICTS